MQGTRHSPEPPALPPRRSSPATTSLAAPSPRPLPRPPPSPPPRPPQRSSSLRSPTKNAMDRKKDLDGKSELINNVKKFLDQTSDKQNRIAKEKIELYQRKKTPGDGYEKKEIIPSHITFCYMCNYYKSKIHFCSAVKKYVNIDERNCVVIKGNTQSSIEGYEEMRTAGWRTKTFATRQEMKQWMRNRVTFLSVWDPLIKENFITSVYDFKKYGEITSVEKAKKKLEKEKNPAGHVCQKFRVSKLCFRMC